MKAVICREYGPLSKLDYAETPDPEAGKGMVVIRTEAIGVNYPDGLLVQGQYQMKPPTPFVPGMEVVGTVEAIGPDVSNFTVGDRVAGLGMLGAYAEKIALPVRSIFALPQEVDGADACAMMCAYGTSHHALKQRAQLKAGETICVLGAAGSTGIAAIQISKIFGARVIAVASSPQKRAIAQAAGADEVIGYDDLKGDLKRLTGNRGVDVLFDPVGGDAFDSGCRAMARGGRLLVIGFASGRIPEFPVNLALVKEFSVVGVFWGSFTQHEPELYAANVNELMGWYAEGKIKPHIEGHYPLPQAPQVLERIMARGAAGKLILVPEEVSK
ncbi:MAG: NADPH:quinone oxidoreductase family protein [Alphaproteobacteria bacterium]|nr:NADPH:quinone oxidoreductase family protein [Alphaproteobacteria bacterium]